MQRIQSTQLLILSLLLLSSPADAATGENIPWSPDQVTGEPNSLKAGDQQTAWASFDQNKGVEWIKLDTRHPLKCRLFAFMNTSTLMPQQSHGVRGGRNRSPDLGGERARQERAHYF